MFIISGNGEVIEPDDGITAIGSGGPMHWQQHVPWPPHRPECPGIVMESMKIAAEICVYTNEQITVEVIE